MIKMGREDLVSGSFEPCATFAGDDAVCTCCGWLAVEHEPDAEIRELVPPMPQPTRMVA